MRLRGGRSAVQAGVAFEVAGVPGARIKLAGVLARGVVSQEPANRLGGDGKMPGVLPRLEQLGGRRECGDLAAGLGRVVLIDSGQDEHRRAEGPHLVPRHADDCPAYAVSGLIAAISHSGTLERIPPGASVSTGNPVPCTVYQILASPRSTYGTRASSRDWSSAAQPMTGPPATTEIGAVGRPHRSGRSAR